jgi:hypothetical protein
MNHERNTGGQLFASESGPIAQVREGMTVRDVHGQEVGTVEFVRMGDHQATAEHLRATDMSNSLTDWLAAAFGDGPQVPEALRQQLLREGFIRVDGPGLVDTDRFVRSDLIHAVTNNEVRLNVPQAALVTRR